MTKIEYLFKQYENILAWYKQSEEKAKFILTLNTFIIGVVNGLVFIGADKIQYVQKLYTTWVWLLLIGSAIALVISYLFILRAIWPRHHFRDASLNIKERLWFFGDIASISREEFNAAFEDWAEADIEATMINQSYILSLSVWIKHEALNKAITFMILALLLFFALGIVYGISVASIPLQPNIGGVI